MTTHDLSPLHRLLSKVGATSALGLSLATLAPALHAANSSTDPAGSKDQVPSPAVTPVEPAQRSTDLPSLDTLVSSQPASLEGEHGHASFTLDEKGLNFRSADGQTTFKLGGRVQADVNTHSEGSVAGMGITDGTELRRARFEMKGKSAGGYIWAAELDMANNNTSVKDFWMGVAGSDGKKLTFGNQKQPFSLGVEMSSNDIPFVERGIDNFLILPFVDRAIGARFDVPGERTYLTGGVFGEGVTGSAILDEGYGATARFIFAPVQSESQTVHLGVRGAVRSPTSADVVRISDESTNMSNFRVVDTGLITDVHQTTLWGVEAAWVGGPLSLTGEFNQVDVGRKGMDPSFGSWHVEGTWSLTGESRADAYKLSSGEFKRLKASSEGKGLFSGGAWELAARFASIDLEDSFVTGGEEDATTLALNWYANRNVRFMLDWTHILNTSGGSMVTTDAEGLDIFTLRAQLTF